MRRLTGMFLTACLIMILTGCGSREDDMAAANTLIIDKNGKVTEEIVENFDTYDYAEEELKEFTLNEIAAYNRTNDTDSIQIDKLTVKEDVLTMKLQYKTSSDYQNFTKQTLFCGTIEEAYAAGYNLDVTLQSVDDTASVGRAELLMMGENRIVITEAVLDIKVPDAILYRSDNVVLKDKKKVTIGSEGLAYIIY